MKTHYTLFFCLSFILVWAQSEIEIAYEKFTLDNGLEVVLHQDASDPMVAIATVVHVGSNREKPGRTGFAHFFEHMAFNDSENVPRGWNRKAIPEWGGSRNGGTWSDGTIYYEVVPKDAFEKILWIDSDRLGYMINTVTKEALEREKQVVKNEKRERVDNSPYGFNNEIIRKNLYPTDHPYNWTVIGELEDLQNATLADVKEFHSQYYGPNNATLVIAGDIDIKATKELVKKWFGEIEKGPEVEQMKPMPVELKETKKLQYEDDFAKLPQLQMVFPGVENYHPDEYALEFLGALLAGSKQTPFYQVIVEDKKLAPNAWAYHSGSELAGEFALSVRANQGVDLDDVKKAIDEAFKLFESKGISNEDMEQIRAQMETRTYRGVETLLDKAYAMSIDNEFIGDPSYITQKAKWIQKVTKEDVMRVYEKYVKNKHYIMTSIVPKGHIELAVEGSKTAEVKKEAVKAEVANEEVSQGEEADYVKTPTKLDRSEPPFGDLPTFKSPKVDVETIEGLKVYGIKNEELPLVEFSWVIDIGTKDENKPGTLKLLESMMDEGTETKNPKELEKALNLLGASIRFSASSEQFKIEGSCLSKNFKPTMKLLEEMLRYPRWDLNEFTRIKQSIITYLKGQESQPTTIGFNVLRKKLFSERHYLGRPPEGTSEGIEQIEMKDLKYFYFNRLLNNLSTSGTFHLVGNLDVGEVKKELQNLFANINSKDLPKDIRPIPDEMFFKHQKNHLFFIDFPDAKQSTIIVGKKANGGTVISSTNWPNGGDPILTFANEILGGGSSGQLFQTLRIEKGYTYGAYSFLRYYQNETAFFAYTNVRANATKNSLEIVEDLIENYADNFDESMTEITKSKVLKYSAIAYESLGDKLNILEEISSKHKPVNYIEQEQQMLKDLTTEDFKKIISSSFMEDDMIYVVVGDKKTQFQAVQEFAKESNKTMVEVDIQGKSVE